MAGVGGSVPHVGWDSVSTRSETGRRGSAVPCPGNMCIHSGSPSRAAMARLDLVSKPLPSTGAAVKRSLRRTVPSFSDSPPPSVMFRRPAPDHRGREQKAVLQTCLSLLAYIKSLGQSSGPEMKELSPKSSQGPQMACSSASFLPAPR